MTTSDGPAFDRWDIGVALFPFTELAQSKPRPVLVLSSAGFNAAHGHVIAAMITTAAESRWDSDHAIRELCSTGLKHASTIRWKLFTLPLDVVPRKIGRLGEEDRSLVAGRMASILLD